MKYFDIIAGTALYLAVKQYIPLHDIVDGYSLVLGVMVTLGLIYIFEKK